MAATHLRVTLLAARNAAVAPALQAAAAPAAARTLTQGAVAAGTVAASSQHPFVWYVHKPAPPAASSTSSSAATLSLSSTSAAFLAAARTRRAARFRAASLQPETFTGHWNGVVITKARALFAQGLAWVEAPTPEGQEKSMRARIQQGYRYVQKQIDPREIALGNVHMFIQQAQEEELKYLKQEQAKEDAALNKNKTTTTPAASTADALSLSSSSPSLPPPSFSLTLSCPSSSSLPSLRSSLLSFLSARQDFHSRRVVLLVALVPLSTLAGILPGPNVFLALNVYRLVGHYQAREGAKELACIIREQTEATETDTIATATAASTKSTDSAAATAATSSEPTDVPVQLQISSYAYDSLQPPSFADLCQQLGMDAQEAESLMQRWK